MATPHILILGATSDIARALARAYAMQGAHLTLAARNPHALMADCTDLTSRGAGSAQAVALDILDTANHGAFVASLAPLPDHVVCVIGLLGNQHAAQTDRDQAATILATNYTGPALLLGEIANRMQVRGAGCIIGISSVAGDRGRASNYLYGSAKAGFTAFLSGLRNRLHRHGIQVVTVKPGFVATRMTEGMALPARLTAHPAEVAQAILRAVARGQSVVYIYPIWRYIMLVITHIPEAIFKKLSL